MSDAVDPKKVAALQRRCEELGIHDADLNEKFVRGSGSGGQKVNKTANAVFLRHEPSGIEVKVHQSRSRETNRFLARRLLVERFEATVLGKKTAADKARDKKRKQKKRRARRTRAVASPELDDD